MLLLEMNTPAVIKGKGSALLKEKVKANEVMYVDGLNITC
jgi:ribose 5-phosphate isomerase